MVLTEQQRQYSDSAATVMNAMCDLAEGRGAKLEQSGRDPGLMRIWDWIDGIAVCFDVVVSGQSHGCLVSVGCVDPEQRYLLERMGVESIFAELEKRLFEREPLRRLADRGGDPGGGVGSV